MRIEVPPGPVYINRELSLSCIVTTDLTVNTETTGHVSWYRDNDTQLLTNDSSNRMTISPTTFNTINVFNSTLTISPLSITDNDTILTCVAVVRPGARLSFITESSAEAAATTINVECNKLNYLEIDLGILHCRSPS